MDHHTTASATTMTVEASLNAVVLNHRLVRLQHPLLYHTPMHPCPGSTTNSSNSPLRSDPGEGVKRESLSHHLQLMPTRHSTTGMGRIEDIEEVQAIGTTEGRMVLAETLHPAHPATDSAQGQKGTVEVDSMSHSTVDPWTAAGQGNPSFMGTLRSLRYRPHWRG